MSDEETVAKCDSGKDTAHSAETVIDGAHVPPQGGYLIPFKPGQSGNPKGRPKDEERLLAMMLRQAPDALERAAKRLAEVLDDPSSRHWLGALKEVTDRREGPVASQTHHHVSTDRAIVTHAQAGPAPELPSAEPPQVE